MILQPVFIKALLCVGHYTRKEENKIKMMFPSELGAGNTLNT